MGQAEVPEQREGPQRLADGTVDPWSDSAELARWRAQGKTIPPPPPSNVGGLLGFRDIVPG